MTTEHTQTGSVALDQQLTRVRAHAPTLVPGLIGVAVMLVWAAKDGGYDPGIWLWGALVLLGTLGAVLVGTGARGLRRSRLSLIALACFALYVAWSYLSISWAQSPGDALQGSNRALLYLLVFTLFLVLPWTPGTATAAMVTFVLGIGVIAIGLLSRLAGTNGVSQLIIKGRLRSPTGYFNATVALFMMGALLAVLLASRRELPGLLRGVLFGFAAAMLQLGLLGESRGWLFTLPFVVVVALAVSKDRLRFTAAAFLPIGAVLIALHSLLAVYRASNTAALDHAARHAGHTALLLCAATFFIGTIIAWVDKLIAPDRISRTRQRQLGAVLAAIAIGGAGAGALLATHGDPFGFASRQLRGFAHPSTQGSGSNFNVVGSGRFDFWRVSLDALVAHPIGGLGQDNFAGYYVKKRHSGEEPSWTHSLEMRLLAHTGLVGFAIFAAFVIAALGAALRARRRGDDRVQFAAGAAMLPFVVWLIHGSVDWFWEMPALSGPALGFLALAGALAAPARTAPAETEPVSRARRLRLPRPVALGAAGVAVLACTAVLGFPYLSVREMSKAGDIASRNSAQALHDLSTAADLNPLSPEPGRLGGTIALTSGRLLEAEQRFRQAITRDPGGWYAWLGAGLAASALGDSGQAKHDFSVAASINSRQRAVTEALRRVDTVHPLTPGQALRLLVIVQ